MKINIYVIKEFSNLYKATQSLHLTLDLNLSKLIFNFRFICLLLTKFLLTIYYDGNKIR